MVTMKKSQPDVLHALIKEDKVPTDENEELDGSVSRILEGDLNKLGFQEQRNNGNRRTSSRCFMSALLFFLSYADTLI